MAAWRGAIPIAVCLGLAAGCRSSEAPPELPRLPAFRMLPDSVSLELAVAQLDPGLPPAEVESLWSELDPQPIAVEFRRRLDRNGIRCGVAAFHPPASFQRLVNAAGDGGPRLVAHQKIQNQAGQTHDLEVAPPVAQLAWSVLGAGQRRRSGSCENATCCLAIRTDPSGDGTVELEVMPRIRYGSPSKRYTVQNNEFSLQPIVHEIDLSELAFRCRLQPGQTLVVGPTDPLSESGRAFFIEPAEGRLRLVLIRLVQTQMDDLFAPDRIQTPLDSRGE